MGPVRQRENFHRAGIGMYYDMVDTLSYLVDQTPPVSGAASFGSQSLFNVIPVSTASQPPACGPGVPIPCSTFAPKSTEPNYRAPVVISWNFTIEQQLNNSTAFRLGYVGFQGDQQFVTIDPTPSRPRFAPAPPVALRVARVLPPAPGLRLPRVRAYFPVTNRPNQYLTS